jgi:hypothetical protein
MNKNATIDFRNPITVRKAGVSALKKELGIVGAAYFMRQISIGQGDYTAERNELLKEIPSDEIAEGIRAIQTEVLLRV